MPKRPTSEPFRQSAELSLEQIERAIPRLQKRIEDLKNLNTSGMHERGGPAIQAIKVSIEQTLEDVFGGTSSEYKRYHPAAILSGGPIVIGRGSSVDHRPYFERSRLSSIALLEQAVQGLIERREDLAGSSPNVSSDYAEEGPAELSNRIFLVHGRDGEHRETVARFLGLLGLEAVILHEQPPCCTQSIPARGLWSPTVRRAAM
ncbi:hypothetical protein [Bradyrhizobium sp. CCBAU 51627]|uniref:hypothetical protein n=1 Tax=Bradyrhizobium sp. CCBAU 51627 TaxID=1325088 RepID=UPI0023064A04|nr:hypothetical protein [Bradyrhizobium sp. CCBAU 51627]